MWVLNRTDPHPTGEPYASALPKCTIGSGQKECITMRYAPTNVTWVEDLMRRVAIRSGLDFETDFAPFDFNLTKINVTTILNDTVYSYFQSHQNETQNGVIFTGGPLPLLALVPPLFERLDLMIVLPSYPLSSSSSGF